MSDNIPFEIQVEIIKRLPVKSLVVFRSVSKAWKTMIDSPLFITDHTNMPQHPRLLIRYQVVNTLSRNLFNYGDTTDFKYVSIMDDGPLSQHEFEIFSTVPLSFRIRYGFSPLLVGTSQGLICLFGYKNRAVIWNPSLRKSIAIDVPELQPYMEVIGFGVRRDNFDPMIVMIGDVTHPNSVLVFTLSSRVWRASRGNFPPKSIGFLIYMSPVATDNRCIYWKAHDGSIYLLIAFDMVSEDLTEINLPRCVAHREGNIDYFSMSMINDSLALLDYDCEGVLKPVCHVWMMVEDGVSKSFTKLFTINTLSFENRVLGFRKNDQPFMKTKIRGKHQDRESTSLEVYEPRIGTIKNLGINGQPDTFFCCSYTETLLLLDQLDEQFIKIQLQ